MKRERRRVRSLAIQVLYEVDTVHHAHNEVLIRVIEENETLSDDAVLFLTRIIEGVVDHADDLDEVVAKAAPEWPVDQLAVLDRNILRMALWEIAVSEDTPLKVAINEAVELAKRFGSESSPRFINGVLGTLAQRESELKRQFLSLN